MISEPAKRPTALACALLLGLIATARTSAQVEDPTARERAVVLLHEGNAKLDQGLYVDALAAFEKAYAIFPSPKLHFNIAQTNHELGRPLEALLHYEIFVAEVKREESREQWQLAYERIFSLQGAIATVEIQTNVIDASVAVDGRDVGATPLSRPLRLLPGAHAVVVSKAGYATHIDPLTLRGGDAVVRRIKLLTDDESAATLRVVQEAEAQRRAALQRLRETQDEERRRQLRARRILRVVGAATLAAGLATLAVGAIFGAIYRDAAATVESTPPGTMWKDLADNSDRAAGFRQSFLVTASVGGLVAAAGCVVLGVSAQRARAEHPATVRPALLVSPTQAALALVGEF